MSNWIMTYVCGIPLNVMFCAIARYAAETHETKRWKRIWSRGLLLTPMWPLYWLYVLLRRLPHAAKILCAEAGWLREKKIQCPYPNCSGVISVVLEKDRYADKWGSIFRHTDPKCIGFLDLPVSNTPLKDVIHYLNHPGLLESEKEVERLLS